ncbi:MAG: hypothetical protein E7514_04245 [Ruminococcaceae bacterium]|nr:hypothetical protein [Oscillospiraceae bacterium]
MIIRLITERTDASIGLRLAGVQTTVARNSEQAQKALDNISLDGNTGILLITSGIEKLCPDTVREIKKTGRPILVTVPDADTGFASSGAISDYVRDAIGISID